LVASIIFCSIEDEKKVSIKLRLIVKPRPDYFLSMYYLVILFHFLYNGSYVDIVYRHTISLFRNILFSLCVSVNICLPIIYIIYTSFDKQTKSVIL